jgi:hypothetical protein
VLKITAQSNPQSLRMLAWQARVSVLDSVFMLGDGVWEG